jgi:hypothetical protein
MMENNILIGISGKAGSGKDTTADFIIEYCSERGILSEKLPYAKSLKNIAKDVFGWDGKKDERGRRLLQVLGTDCARTYNNNFWLEKWLECYQNISIKNDKRTIVFVPDVRFQNEAEQILSLGGTMINIVGRSSDLGSNEKHISEIPLEPNLINYTIENSGSLDGLKSKAISLFVFISTFYSLSVI